MSLVRQATKVEFSVFDLLSNTSTIHGMKYIGDEKSPRSTRAFWMVAFAFSIIGCIYYATMVYEKYWLVPDIGLKVDYKSIRTVPFPSITICPQTKVSEKNI
jgi:amiloride-sensitive sodium channel